MMWIKRLFQKKPIKIITASFSDFLESCVYPLEPKYELFACVICRKVQSLPFRCNYCGKMFCDDHRLPEDHGCLGLPNRSWENFKKHRKADEKKRGVWGVV